MSKKDATPSLSPDAAIPEHLRAKVRVAAQWRVVNACKTVAVPQNIDAICDAVHDLDGFDSGDLPAETLIALGKRPSTGGCPTPAPTPPSNGKSYSTTSTPSANSWQ